MKCLSVSYNKLIYTHTHTHIYSLTLICTHMYIHTHIHSHLYSYKCTQVNVHIQRHTCIHPHALIHIHTLFYILIYMHITKHIYMHIHLLTTKYTHVCIYQIPLYWVGYSKRSIIKPVWIQSFSSRLVTWLRLKIPVCLTIYLMLGVWFALLLWYIKHCRLFNAKSALYICIKHIWFVSHMVTVRMQLLKAWTAINKLSMIWKSDLSDKTEYKNCNMSSGKKSYIIVVIHHDVRTFGV